MVVPSSQVLLGRLAETVGLNLAQREAKFREDLIKIAPFIFWGATPSEIELMPFLEPILARRLYKVEFDTPPRPGVPKQLLVDLKLGPTPLNGDVWAARNARGSNSLEHGCRIQEMARSKIPNMIPRVFRVGTCTETGSAIEYVVSEYMPGTVTLDTVWSSLSTENQSEIMDDLVGGLEKIQEEDAFGVEMAYKLYDIDLSGDADFTVDNAVSPGDDEYSNLEDSGCDIHDVVRLLYPSIILQKFDRQIRNRHQEGTTYFIQLPGTSLMMGTIVSFEDYIVHSCEFTTAEITELTENMSFCHMDLEPRNILVKLVLPESATAAPKYKLAAITSWQNAIMAPFSFERGVKDGMLGCQFNHDYSWYKLFVERTKHLVPDGLVHEKFLGATLRIKMGCRLVAGDMPNSMHQAQWLAKEKLVIGRTFLDGYVREEGAEDMESPSDREYREMGDAIITAHIARLSEEADEWNGQVNDPPEDASETDCADGDSDRTGDTYSVDDHDD